MLGNRYLVPGGLRLKLLFHSLSLVVSPVSPVVTKALAFLHSFSINMLLASLYLALLAVPFSNARLDQRAPNHDIIAHRATAPDVKAAWYAGKILNRMVSIANAKIKVGWHATKFPLASVPWSKYTHMTYAFAYVPQPKFFDVN